MCRCRTFFNHAELLDFAEMGSYLEYDLFGIETLNYVLNMDVDMPSDSQRINTSVHLPAHSLDIQSENWTEK